MVARNGPREPGFLAIYQSFLPARTVWRFFEPIGVSDGARFLESGHTTPFASEAQISNKKARLCGDASPNVGWPDEVERILAAVSG